jgi:hypothetical protein
MLPLTPDDAALADVSVTEPLAELLLEPLPITTLAPTPFVDMPPADNTSAPPTAPDVVLPTKTLMEPPLPLDELPVVNAIQPLFAPGAAALPPVLSNSVPDTPVVDASADASTTLPDPELLLSPLKMRTEPPTFVVECAPAVRDTAPPPLVVPVDPPPATNSAAAAPDDDAPTTTLTAPATPLVTAPLVISSQPLFPLLLAPELSSTVPDAPALATGVVTITEPDPELVLEPDTSTTASPTLFDTGDVPTYVNELADAVVDAVPGAISTSVPPDAPESLRPTMTLMAPARPLVTEPVLSTMDPAVPSVAAPVLNRMEPVTPMDAAFAVAMVTEPDAELLLVPDAICTLPPRP